MSRKEPGSPVVATGPALPRRRFLQGLVTGGVLLGAGDWVRPAWSQTGMADTRNGTAQILSGTEFNLTIAESLVNFTGAPKIATTVNSSIPAPTLRWREGDTVTISVTNRLSLPTSIHWHGMLLPYQMDGVPGISFTGIRPGQTFTYRFKVRQSGTFWYHSHTGFQEQTGLYGAIIIEPRDGETIHADQDHIVQLSDWTDENPMTVFAKLKKHGDYYNFIKPTVGDFFHDVSTISLSSAMARRRMWNIMRMNPTDLVDISGYTYTYLMNGTTPAGNWTGTYRKGQRVRLRFINSATQSFFDVHIPNLPLTVVQADGQNVEPVTVDEFRMGPGETCDVIVTPEDEAYTLFAQSMDRSGYARGTLATRPGLVADVPEMDAPAWLNMTDMMGSMGRGEMSDMSHMHHGNMEMEAATVRHASSEYGPGVDMRVDTARTNLDDPGVGLRDNGRRVLTYADLHTIGGPLDSRDPGREIELHLTGNMERYTWSLDGLAFGESTPVHFRPNERLRVFLHNDTMMTHPMHLHGMWQELENPAGDFQVRKHTINVQPAQRVSFLVTADALGRWAWHCHLLYHMEAGMFREVVVA